MTDHVPRDAKGWATGFAALLLAAQAILLAFSLGAGAAPVLRDRFGNVLCATGAAAGDHRVPSGSGDRHANPLDCCTAGCPMVGGGLAVPETDAVFARPFAFYRRPFFARHADGDAARMPLSPHRARAPPPFA